MKKLSVRAVIEKNGKYLVARLVIADNFWCLPGGSVEDGEDLLTALRRELLEELGVEPVIGNLLCVHQLKKKDGGVDSTSFFFHVRNVQDFLNIDLSKTSHGELEIVEVDFKDLSKTHVLPSFLKQELEELRVSNFALPSRVRITEYEDNL